MRLTLILALVGATLALGLTPSASAHECNGNDCGPCVKNERHDHNDWRHGQCSSGPGYHAENGWNGQRFTPGAGALLSVAAIGGVALLLARRG